MTRGDDQRFADILAACSELELVSERGKRDYDADPLLRRAAERLLEIIGESAKRCRTRRGRGTPRSLGAK